MKKLKEYLVVVEEFEPDEDEFVIEAKGLREAKKKAERIVKKDYIGMEIVSITEED